MLTNEDYIKVATNVMSVIKTLHNEETSMKTNCWKFKICENEKSNTFIPKKEIIKPQEVGIYNIINYQSEVSFEIGGFPGTYYIKPKRSYEGFIKYYNGINCFKDDENSPPCCEWMRNIGLKFGRDFQDTHLTCREYNHTSGTKIETLETIFTVLVDGLFSKKEFVYTFKIILDKSSKTIQSTLYEYGKLIGSSRIIPISYL